jgi:hypothetical protein
MMMRILKNKTGFILTLFLLSYQPVVFGSLMSNLQFQFSTIFSFLYHSPFKQVKRYAVPAIKTGSVTGILLLANLTPFGKVATCLAIGYLFNTSDGIKGFMDIIFHKQESLFEQQKVTDGRVQDIQGTLGEHGIGLNNISLAQERNEANRQCDQMLLMRQQANLQEEQRNLVEAHAKTQSMVAQFQCDQDTHNKKADEEAEKQSRTLNQLLDQQNALVDHQKNVERLITKNKEEVANTFKVGLDGVRRDMQETIEKSGDDIANKVAEKLNQRPQYRAGRFSNFYQQ